MARLDKDMAADLSSGMNPAAFMVHWQKAGLQLMRAQERVLHGMLSAARAEVQFGHDLLIERMTSLNAAAHGETQTGVPEVERLLTMVREVTEELNTGFSEAAKMVAEGLSFALEEEMEETEAGAKMTKKTFAEREGATGLSPTQHRGDDGSGEKRV